MEELRKTLAPLTDWMPAGLRDQFAVEIWWLIYLGLAVLLLLLLFLILRGMVRGLLGGKRQKVPWERKLRENLAACPLPTTPQGNLVLSVLHLPVRVRLVVVAPAGRDAEIDAVHAEKLLDRLVPGLGKVIERDRPWIRVWPAQLSHQGFMVTFHRCTPIPEGEDRPTRWILLAGRTLLGKQSFLLGLGLWADEANTIGRKNMEPHQWLDLLRLRLGEK
jgi:hypothetical protein